MFDVAESYAGGQCEIEMYVILNCRSSLLTSDDVYAPLTVVAFSRNWAIDAPISSSLPRYSGVHERVPMTEDFPENSKWYLETTIYLLITVV